MRNIFGKLVALPVIATLALAVLSSPSYAAPTDAQLKKKAIQAMQIEMREMKKSKSFMQWTFEGGKHGQNIYSGRKYQLLNLSERSGLARHKRKWSKAADLGFSNAGRNITFQKLGKSPLRYGDTVALHVKKYGWLKYQNRGKYGSGINLGAPKKGSKFNWVIGGGTRGNVVKTGFPFTLKNKTNNRLVRHCGRSFGIDLDWSGASCGSFWAKLSNKIWGKNGSSSLKGRFCNAAAASGRVYAAVKTAGVSEVKAEKVIKAARKVCNR